METFELLVEEFKDAIIRYKWNNQNLEEAFKLPSILYIPKKGFVEDAPKSTKILGMSSNHIIDLTTPLKKAESPCNQKKIYQSTVKKQKKRETNLILLDLSLEKHILNHHFDGEELNQLDDDEEEEDQLSQASFVMRDSMIESGGESEPEDGENLNSDSIVSEDEDENEDSFVVPDDHESSRSDEEEEELVASEEYIDQHSFVEDDENDNPPSFEEELNTNYDHLLDDHNLFDPKQKTQTKNSSTSANKKKDFKSGIDNFKKKPLIEKLEIARKYFEHYNKTAFSGKLPNQILIEFNKNLRTTAGKTLFKLNDYSNVTIQLSTKVLDTVEKLKSTLVHEMVHAAVYNNNFFDFKIFI